MIYSEQRCEGLGRQEENEEVAKLLMLYAGPVNGIAAEERGCALGKAGDSWGREALGKHLLDHL